MESNQKRIDDLVNEMDIIMKYNNNLFHSKKSMKLRHNYEKASLAMMRLMIATRSWVNNSIISDSEKIELPYRLSNELRSIKYITLIKAFGMPRHQSLKNKRLQLQHRHIFRENYKELVYLVKKETC